MRCARAMLLVVALASVPACHKRSEPTVMSTHSSNGLRLSLPASLPVGGMAQPVAVAPTAAGFQVTLAGQSVRRVAIVASLALRGGPAPAGTWPEERDVGGRRIHYRIDRSEGGSGGTQVDFHAWEACAGGYLEYAQGDVVEWPSEPDFTLVWRVIAGTQPRRKLP